MTRADERARRGREARERLFADYVETSVHRVFEHYPTLRSAVFLVAQYWNDEANDAVHAAYIFSELDMPDLAAGLRSLDEELPEALDTSEWSPEHDALYGIDLVNLHSLSLRQAELGVQKVRHWDPNHDPVPAFAAFCKEGAHQGMRHADAYTPYALLFRDGRVRKVTQMLRPHLDGISAEWG